MKKPRFGFFFSLAQFECILHVTHFDFIVAKNKEKVRKRKEKKKTKPEQRIISASEIEEEAAK